MVCNCESVNETETKVATRLIFFFFFWCIVGNAICTSYIGGTPPAKQNQAQAGAHGCRRSESTAALSKPELGPNTTIGQHLGFWNNEDLRKSCVFIGFNFWTKILFLLFFLFGFAFINYILIYVCLVELLIKSPTTTLQRFFSVSSILFLYSESRLLDFPIFETSWFCLLVGFSNNFILCGSTPAKKGT